jgi:hypothetical protein
MTQPPDPWLEWNNAIAAAEDTLRQAEDAIIAEQQRRDTLAGYSKRAQDARTGEVAERFPALRGRVEA